MADRNHVAGVDVSAAQGSIDWSAVRGDGFAFAFLKATVGSGQTDPRFGSSWEACRDAGLMRAAYHVLDPSVSAMKQARRFLNVARPQMGDLPPALAVASPRGASPAALLDCAAEWLEIVGGTIGAKPVVATAARLWNRLIDGAEGADVAAAPFGEHPLWVIAPGADEPQVPRSWDDWTFWRAEDDRRVAGIDGPVHVDRYAGATPELLGLLLR